MIAINVQTAENTNKKQQYRDVGDSVQRPLAGLILMAKRIDFAHTDRPDSARKFSVAESLTAPRTYRETRSRLPVAAMELPGHQVSPGILIFIS
jgi:hypothetical protein